MLLMATAIWYVKFRDAGGGMCWLISVHVGFNYTTQDDTHSVITRVCLVNDAIYWSNAAFLALATSRTPQCRNEAEA